MFLTFLGPPTSLMIYSTVNHQKLTFSNPTHPPLWWRNTWMVPFKKNCYTKKKFGRPKKRIWSTKKLRNWPDNRYTKVTDQTEIVSKEETIQRKKLFKGWNYWFLDFNFNSTIFHHRFFWTKKNFVYSWNILLIIMHFLVTDKDYLSF